MKKALKTIIITTLVMLFGISSYAQVNSNKEKLIGTWTLDYNKAINELKSEAKQHYDAFDSDRKQKLQTSFSQRKMTFEADGSYTLVVNADRQVTGTWDLKQDGVTLELVTNGRTIIHTIGKISNQNMELLLEKSTTSKQLFGTWHLNKVSN
ncbi:hypothetical protein [Pontimicrobium sp. SW4]|uniref:Lipocalin-like domain-containing protein n=1 Tax=Pontimicrobium sp. SW4 TaxID=3153519 RepID=A0AAU7BS28_9FLAO